MSMSTIEHIIEKYPESKRVFNTSFARYTKC